MSLSLAFRAKILCIKNIKILKEKPTLFLSTGTNSWNLSKNTAQLKSSTYCFIGRDLKPVNQEDMHLLLTKPSKMPKGQKMLYITWKLDLRTLLSDGHTVSLRYGIYSHLL